MGDSSMLQIHYVNKNYALILLKNTFNYASNCNVKDVSQDIGLGPCMGLQGLHFTFLRFEMVLPLGYGVVYAPII